MLGCLWVHCMYVVCMNVWAECVFVCWDGVSVGCMCKGSVMTCGRSMCVFHGYRYVFACVGMCVRGNRTGMKW
jgi:hypothetical protein